MTEGNSLAPEMMALSEALGQLHTLVSEGQRDSRERSERAEQTALVRHEKLESRVTGLYHAHATLAREVASIKERQVEGSKVVSEHTKEDETNMAGLRGHLGNVDTTLAKVSERLGSLNTTTSGQNTVLDTQTGLLQDQAKWAKVRTILTAVGASVGAAIASYLAARGH